MFGHHGWIIFPFLLYAFILVKGSGKSFKWNVLPDRSSHFKNANQDWDESLKSCFFCVSDGKLKCCNCFLGLRRILDRPFLKESFIRPFVSLHFHPFVQFGLLVTSKQPSSNFFCCCIPSCFPRITMPPTSSSPHTFFITALLRLLSFLWSAAYATGATSAVRISIQTQLSTT